MSEPGLPPSLEDDATPRRAIGDPDAGPEEPIQPAGDSAPRPEQTSRAEPTAADRTDETPRRAAAARPRRRGPGLVTSIGILLICLGLAGFGWIGYQYYGTNAPSEQAAQTESSTLRDEWRTGSPSASQAPTGSQAPVAPPSAGSTGVPADQPATVSLDKAMAIIRIPRFGPSYEKPILAGTSDYALARGVAWYETTARPGQIGNFALAGHRITHGEPFARLLELQVGDEVVIETRDYVYTYVIDTPPARLTVKDVDTWVIDPVPGKKDVKPTKALLTLTTCQDLFHSPDRSVGFASLAKTVKK